MSSNASVKAVTVDTVERANTLCDQDQFVVGSFGKDQVEDAKTILSSLQVQGNSAVAVSTYFRLIRRLFEEMSYVGSFCGKIHTVQNLNQSFNRVLIRWKELLLNGQSVASPSETVELMLELQRKEPYFQVSSFAVSIVFGALIRTVPRRKAPLELEKIIRETNVELSSHMSCQIAQAWASSRLPESNVKINEIFERYKTKEQTPDIVLINVLLGCYGRQKNIDMLETTAESMKVHGLQPTLATWSNLVHGYSNCGKLELALESLSNMVKEVPSIPEDTVARCVQAILRSVRQRTFARPNPPKRYLSGIAGKVEVIGSKALTGRARDRMLGALMEINVQLRQYEQAEKIMEHVANPASAEFATIVKAWGLANQPSLAQNWLEKMLSSDGVRPGLDAFNACIHAWAISADPNRTDRAFEVLKTLGLAPQCGHLKADLVTYNCVLKSLALFDRDDSGRRAVDLLDSMAKRGCNPDHISYRLAHKACMRSRDYERADRLWSMIETMRPLPGTKFFNGMLAQWLKVRSPKGALSIDKMLERMKRLSTENPNLAPDIYSYRILIQAWIDFKGDTILSHSKIVRAVEEMERIGVEADLSIAGSLVLYHCYRGAGSPERVAMAESYFKKLRPADEQHYVAMFRAFFAIGNVDRAGDFFLDWAKTENLSVARRSQFLQFVVRSLGLKRRPEHLRKMLSILTELDETSDEEGEEDCIPENVFTYAYDLWEESELLVGQEERDSALSLLRRKQEMTKMKLKALQSE